MLFNPQHEDRLGLLANRLRLANAVTPDLVADVIAEACSRVSGRTAGRSGRLRRLIEAGAWTDVALSLIDLALPQWRLRRLVLDDGEWVCSLSAQPVLPIEIDETVDGRHEVLALAVLCALAEARRSSTEACAASPVPRFRQVTDTMCCDNFA